MKALIAVMVLFLVASVSAAEPPNAQNSIDSAANFILSINPLFLIVGGILLIVASSLAKLIGVGLLLIGIVSLALSVM